MPYGTRDSLGSNNRIPCLNHHLQEGIILSSLMLLEVWSSHNRLPLWSIA